MQLESVYELKKVFASSLAQRFSPPPVASQSEGIATFYTLSTQFAQPASPTVGLGVARKSGKKPDYMLAVRYDNGDDQRIGQILGELQQKTKGEMDAQEVGQIRALNWYQQANRPCVAGSSVMLEGHNGAGTLGAFVHRDDDEAVYLLSNSHVIADSGNAQLGDAVIQPGGLDGGTRSDRIATLSEHAPIDFTSGLANNIDAAIARIDDGVQVRTGYAPPFGDLQGVGDLIARFDDDANVFVDKMGRTTGPTRGVFSAFDIDVTVDYGNGRLAKFANQLEFKTATAGQTFSNAGDSGSIILDEDRYGVGLLFAGNPTGGRERTGVTYANLLLTVLDKLHIRLAV